MAINAVLPDMRRRTVRAEVNPMDKSTVVSICPLDIDETKVTLQPGRFIIPAGNYEKPSLLVVGPSSWWRELDEDQPLLEIPVSSIAIADSIVVDYCNGMIACNMGDIMPGLFFIPGDINLTELRTKYKNRLDAAQIKQRNWYAALVKEADKLWARTNGNPIAISDIMRLGARELGLNTKEWLQDFQAMEMIRCVACGQMRNPTYPVCPSCHAVIDKKRAEELGIVFAKA